MTNHKKYNFTTIRKIVYTSYSLWVTARSNEKIFREASCWYFILRGARAK